MMSGIVVDPEPEHRLPGKVCYCISPSVSGVVSLCLQFVILVVTVLVSIFLFYHAGGYEYMGWNENSTMLEPIKYDSIFGPELFGAEYVDDEIWKEESVGDDITLRLTDDNEADKILNSVQSLENSTLDEIGSGEEIHERNHAEAIHILSAVNHTRMELEILEMVRLSTLVYFAIAIFWLLSLFLLLCSIKYEVLDLVCINSFILTVASLYIFIHAMFIGVLLYYQPHLTWRTLAIVSGSVIVLLVGTFLGGIALHLDIAWYKYIVYGHGEERFLIVEKLVRAIKCHREEAAHPSLSYQRGAEPGGSNDQVIFSAF